MLIGKLIRLYRDSERKSLKQMAKIIGVDYVSLSRFERGQNIRSQSWVAVIKWLLTSETSTTPKRK